MSELPWSKFYWSDYDADEGLRLCSLAAQGLWMRMLCLMARATPKGELRIAGEPCSVRDLARSVSESEETVAALLDELRRRGVFSATRAGVIFSRRMRKDGEISRKRAEAGSKGGRASLGKQSVSEICSSKTQANREAKAKPQKPEARSQRPDSPPNPPPKTRAGPSPELAAVMEAGRYVQIPPDHPLLAEWLEAGADLDSQIVPVIRTETEKLIGRTNRGPLKLVVFDAAVRQRIADDQRESERRRRSIEHMRRIEEEQERERVEEARLREQFRPAAVAAASGGRS